MDTDAFENIEVDEIDSSYLENPENLHDRKLRLLKGDKAGSTWLVIDEQFIFHKNDCSIDGDQTYLECCRRKQAG